MDRMTVAPADLHIGDTERISRIVAEARALELVEALADAILGAPGWRHQAQLLLAAIAAGSLPEPGGRT
jgi:hypothetical protein